MLREMQDWDMCHIIPKNSEKVTGKYSLLLLLRALLILILLLLQEYHCHRK